MTWKGKKNVNGNNVRCLKRKCDKENEGQGEKEEEVIVKNKKESRGYETKLNARKSVAMKE